MTDLESCYFCGRVEDLGEYATPPDRLLPVDHEPQSALLCPDCRTKLRGILEPIAARVEQLESGPGPEARAATSSDQPAPQTATPGENGAPADSEDTDTDADGGPDATADPADESARASVEDLATEAAAGAGGDTPPQYRRVLRLLRNRDLPMERSAVVALASGAYDIDDAECEAILDAAIERGDLGESGAQITN